VRKSSSYYQTLKRLQVKFPEINIQEAPEKMNTEEIIYHVGKGKYPFTLCDSDIAKAMLRYRDDFKPLLEMTDYQPICWAVGKGCEALLKEVNQFIVEQSLTRNQDSLFSGGLKGIKKRKILRIGTRNNPLTYWMHRGVELGFEFELCRAFAKHLNVRIEMVIAPSRDKLLEWLNNGKADIVAACLTATDNRKKIADFGFSYLNASEVVVCLKDKDGKPVVKNIDDLSRYPVHVRKSSSYYSTLKRLEKETDKKFNIQTLHENMETEEILRRMSDTTFQVTICDDYITKMEIVYNRSLAISIPIREKQPIAWAIRKNSPLLLQAIDDFFQKTDYKPKGLKYNMLYNKYFKNKRINAKAHSLGRIDKHGTISKYDAIIKKYGEIYNLDWRILAAQIFQESQFDPNAKSWVGALGLMQIMPKTAQELHVGDIKKPNPAIHGGAKYMRRLIDRFDKGLSFKSRYHFALASYNAGYGHVLDARRLARDQNLDPDLWFGNVEKAMLLLANPHYANKARYGYCRGREPVIYVENIQRLFDRYIQQVQ